MQIVIDIPERMMSYINKNEFNAISEAMYGCLAMIAIKTGTPLPKGHGRLIDSDVLKKYIEDCDCCVECEDESYGCADRCKCPDYLDEGMERIINNQPTVIEADKEVQE